MQAPFCRDCISGDLRSEVSLRGTEKVIYGLPTYVVHPPPGIAPTGIVVIVSDAFGWKLPNTRALADAYASRVPCTVYLPDFMDGHALPVYLMHLLDSEAPNHTAQVPLPFRLLKQAWALVCGAAHLLRFAYFNRQSVTGPRSHAFMRAVRTTPGPSGQKNSSLPPKVGVAGFCWGGLYTVLWTHDTPPNKVVIPSKTAARRRGRRGDRSGAGTEYPLVDCAFTAHPSMLKIPEQIEMVVQPLGVANGDNDQWMGEAKMKQLVAILQSKNEAAGREVYEAVVYEGAKHGFATRADRDDPKQLEIGDKCEDQAVRWFKRHFES